MPIPVEKLHTPTYEQEPALRSAGRLILKVLQEPPVQAYLAREMVQAILSKAGVPDDLRAVLAGSDLLLRLFGIGNLNVAEFNERRVQLVDSMLNAMIAAGDLHATVYEGEVYLHPSRPAQLTQTSFA